MESLDSITPIADPDIFVADYEFTSVQTPLRVSLTSVIHLFSFTNITVFFPESLSLLPDYFCVNNPVFQEKKAIWSTEWTLSVHQWMSYGKSVATF